MGFNIPKTLEDAQKYRYGAWSGMPKGTKYQDGRCAYEVWNGPRGMTASQCSFKNGHGPHGLFCKTHAKKVGN